MGVGSGLVNLATGKNASIPPSLTDPPPGTPETGTMLGPTTVVGTVEMGPDDNLYDVVGPRYASRLVIWRWSTTRRTWSVARAVATPTPTYARPSLGQDGSLWWAIPVAASHPHPPQWTIMRTIPGRRGTQRWHVSGALIGMYPGYFAYIPMNAPAELVMDFPLAGRVLRFSHLTALPGPPYFLNAPAQMGTGWSTLTNAQVVYLGTAQGERTLIITSAARGAPSAT